MSQTSLDEDTQGGYPKEISLLELIAMYIQPDNVNSEHISVVKACHEAAERDKADKIGSGVEFTAGKMQIPNLANATPSMLIDEIGPIRVEVSRLTALNKMYTAALKARVASLDSPLAGDTYVMTPTTFMQTRIDVEKVRAVLDEETLAKVQSTSEVTQMRFKRKDGQKG